MEIQIAIWTPDETHSSVRSWQPISMIIIMTTLMTTSSSVEPCEAASHAQRRRGSCSSGKEPGTFQRRSVGRSNDAHPFNLDVDAACLGRLHAERRRRLCHPSTTPSAWQHLLLCCESHERSPSRHPKGLFEQCPTLATTCRHRRRPRMDR